MRLIPKQRYQTWTCPCRKGKEIQQFRQTSHRIRPAARWGGAFASDHPLRRQRRCLSNRTPRCQRRGRCLVSQIISSKTQPSLSFIAWLLPHVPEMNAGQLCQLLCSSQPGGYPQPLCSRCFRAVLAVLFELKKSEFGCWERGDQVL